MSVDQKERNKIPYSPEGPLGDTQNRDTIDGYDRDNDGLNDYEKDFSYKPDNNDLTREGLQAEEEKPSGGPSNDSLGTKDNKPVKRSFWSNKRKAIAGGVASGGVGVSLLFFGLITPFKVPSIANLVTDAVSQRVEYITTYRMKVIIARAILQQFGVKAGPVVTGEGPISSLIATLRTNNFEKKLAEKGLKIEKYGDGVRLSTTDGFKSGSLKNEAEIVKILDQNKLSRGAINQLVKEEIPTWRFMKRIKFGTWLRLKYAIPYYSRDKTKASDADPKDDAETQRAKTTRQAGIDEIDGAVKKKSGALKNFLSWLRGGGVNSSGQLNDPAISGTEDAVNKSIVEDANVKKGALKNASTKEAIAIMTKAGLETSFTAASRAIPVYGWIMLYATIYSAADVIYESSRDGKLAQLLADIRGSQLAAIYGQYAGLGSQYQLGEQDRDLMEYDSAKFDGVETSYIYNCVNDNYTSGCEQKGDKSGVKINENVEGDVLADLLVSLYGLDTSVAGPYADFIGITSLPQRKIARVLFWIDDGTVGEVFRAAGGVVSWAATGLITLIPGAQEAVNAIKKIVDNLTDQLWGFTLKLLGLSVDPLATGPELFNNMFAGGVFGMTNFCREQLGCHDISSATGKTQDNRFAQENSEYLRSKGMAYALFSPEVTTSVTSKLAMSIPSDSGRSTANWVLGPSSKLLGSIAQLISPRLTGTSYADSIVTPASLVGMRETGFSDEELDSLVDDRVAYEEGYDCEGSTNPMCKVDKMLIETIGVCADPKNIESPECNPDVEQTSSLQGAPAAGGDTPTASGGATFSGTAQEAARKLLSHPNFSVVDRYAYQIRGYAEGNVTCKLDEALLITMAGAVDKIRLSVTSLNRGCVGSMNGYSSTSFHYNHYGPGNGGAVDLAPYSTQVMNALLANAPINRKYQIGQQGCRPAGSLISSGRQIVEIPDSCNHVHFGVYPL